MVHTQAESRRQKDITGVQTVYNQVLGRLNSPCMSIFYLMGPLQSKSVTRRAQSSRMPAGGPMEDVILRAEVFLYERALSSKNFKMSPMPDMCVYTCCVAPGEGQSLERELVSIEVHSRLMDRNGRRAISKTEKMEREAQGSLRGLPGRKIKALSSRCG